MTETTCDELTATPFPAPLDLCRGRGRGFVSKVKPVKKRRVEGKWRGEIWFYFLLPYAGLTGNKIKRFPRVQPVLPMR